MSDEAMTQDIRQLHLQSWKALLSPRFPASPRPHTDHALRQRVLCRHIPLPPPPRRGFMAKGRQFHRRCLRPEGRPAGDLPRARGKEEDWGQELTCPECPPGRGLRCCAHTEVASVNPHGSLPISQPNRNGGISLVAWLASEQQGHDAGPGPCEQPRPLSPNKLKVCT